MPYTPPDGDDVTFDFVTAYSGPPDGDDVVFDFGAVAPGDAWVPRIVVF